MSIPKNGRFHKHEAYVTKVYDVGKWIDNKYVGEHTVRLTSWQSVVVDYNEDTRTITLYPRWQYSSSTIRQVCRFIHECTGVYYNPQDLRMFHKIQEHNGMCDRNTLGDLFVFSKEYPNG